MWQRGLVPSTGQPSDRPVRGTPRGKGLALDF